MAKIHRFLLIIKEADRTKRAAKEKEKDPFAGKEGVSTVIARKLTYAESQETKKLNLRELRREECKDENEHKDSRQIVNFISHRRWATEKNPHGGITWLEFYILFRLHKPESKTSWLKSKSSLQAQIAAFKKHVRTIETLCLGVEDEWQLNTCYGRCNRLRAAGVENKHAALQGMPRIPPQDADRIMHVIQQMRGSIGTKKNKDLFEKGSLKTKSNSFSYKKNCKSLV